MQSWRNIVCPKSNSLTIWKKKNLYLHKIQARLLESLKSVCYPLINKVGTRREGGKGDRKVSNVATAAILTSNRCSLVDTQQVIYLTSKTKMLKMYRSVDEKHPTKSKHPRKNKLCRCWPVRDSHGRITWSNNIEMSRWKTNNFFPLNTVLFLFLNRIQNIWNM